MTLYINLTKQDDSKNYTMNVTTNMTTHEKTNNDGYIFEGHIDDNIPEDAITEFINAIGTELRDDSQITQINFNNFSEQLSPKIADTFSLIIDQLDAKGKLENISTDIEEIKETIQTNTYNESHLVAVLNSDTHTISIMPESQSRCLSEEKGVQIFDLREQDKIIETIKTSNTILDYLYLYDFNINDITLPNDSLTGVQTLLAKLKANEVLPEALFIENLYNNISSISSTENPYQSFATEVLNKYLPDNHFQYCSLSSDKSNDFDINFSPLLTFLKSVPTIVLNNFSTNNIDLFCTNINYNKDKSQNILINNSIVDFHDNPDLFQNMMFGHIINSDSTSETPIEPVTENQYYTDYAVTKILELCSILDDEKEKNDIYRNANIIFYDLPDKDICQRTSDYQTIIMPLSSLQKINEHLNKCFVNITIQNIKDLGLLKEKDQKKINAFKNAVLTSQTINMLPEEKIDILTKTRIFSDTEIGIFSVTDVLDNKYDCLCKDYPWEYNDSKAKQYKNIILSELETATIVPYHETYSTLGDFNVINFENAHLIPLKKSNKKGNSPSETKSSKRKSKKKKKQSSKISSNKKIDPTANIARMEELTKIIQKSKSQVTPKPLAKDLSNTDTKISSNQPKQSVTQNSKPAKQDKHISSTNISKQNINKKRSISQYSGNQKWAPLTKSNNTESFKSSTTTPSAYPAKTSNTTVSKPTMQVSKPTYANIVNKSLTNSSVPVQPTPLHDKKAVSVTQNNRPSKSSSSKNAKNVTIPVAPRNNSNATLNIPTPQTRKIQTSTLVSQNPASSLPKQENKEFTNQSRHNNVQITTTNTNTNTQSHKSYADVLTPKAPNTSETPENKPASSYHSEATPTNLCSKIDINQRPSTDVLVSKAPNTSETPENKPAILYHSEIKESSLTNAYSKITPRYDYCFSSEIYKNTTTPDKDNKEAVKTPDTEINVEQASYQYSQNYDRGYYGGYDGDYVMGYNTGCRDAFHQAYNYMSSENNNTINTSVPQDTDTNIPDHEPYANVAPSNSSNSLTTSEEVPTTSNNTPSPEQQSYYQGYNEGYAKTFEDAYFYQTNMGYTDGYHYHLGLINGYNYATAQMASQPPLPQPPSSGLNNHSQNYYKNKSGKRFHRRHTGRY